jgi:twitching motility protein PilT
MAEIDRFFQAILENGASDLHLAQGQPPKMRLHGAIHPIEETVLTEDAMSRFLREICLPDRWDRYTKHGDLDFAYALGTTARFRANYYRHTGGYGAIFRIIPADIQTVEQLGLPPVLKSFGDLANGLVLVTGPTGSGKSTTLAAIIDTINANFARHILTIEEPIEFVHPEKRSVIVQREVGLDTPSFGEALMAAAHSDCDVILVGEMRDLETISLAITAAESGNLVFGTLHTNSAGKTIDRIIDVFPPDQQSQIRTMLSESLKGVCSQLLLKKKAGGRIAANEILIHTPAVANIIREGGAALSKLHSVMLSGKSLGMQVMDDTIEHFLMKNLVSGREAYMKALEKERFEARRDED